MLRLLAIGDEYLIRALHESILGLTRGVLRPWHILVLTQSLTTANTSALEASAEARGVS